MVQSRVRRLVNKTQFAPHQYAVGTDTFPRLNLDHVSRDLRLVELGQERGLAEEPPQTEEGLDEVEERVIGYIRNKHAEARSAFEEQRQTYQQRLSKLGLHTAAAEIDDATKSAIATIEAETLKSRDLVPELRAAIQAGLQDWETFREENALARAARYPEGAGAHVLRWGIVLAILLIEAAANGYFFAQGSDLGLVGGWFEAGLIAAINVSMGLAAGHVPARWISHRQVGKRVVGGILLFAWFVLAIGFNLAVGHYRNAMEALSQDPAAQALETFAYNPTGLASIHSWMLFAVGVAFSLIAFIDGLSMDDRYPGYGAVDRQLKAAKQRFVDERADLLDQVGEIYDESVGHVAAMVAQIGKRRGESDEIGAGLQSLRQSFQAHLEYLEESANGLLQIYRDANRKARPPRTAPTSFRKRWKRDFPMPDVLQSMQLSDTAFEALQRKAQDRRRLGERRLEKARASAASAFPSLGEID